MSDIQKSITAQISDPIDIFSRLNTPDPKLMYFRIPAILKSFDVVNGRTILNAFCEARTAWGDYTNRTLLQSRSTDGGKSWSAPCFPTGLPAFSANSALGNPTLIPGAEAGRIHLVYCDNYTSHFHCVSDNFGVSWTVSSEIVLPNPLGGYNWKIIAIGPGHGIRDDFGRLIAGVWMSVDDQQLDTAVATVFSADEGATWKPGEIMAIPSSDNPMEPCVVNLSGKGVLANIRQNLSGGVPNCRKLSTGPDGISGWSVPGNAQSLEDPGCFGSMDTLQGGSIVFTNVNGTDPAHRQPLGLKISQDGGESWNPVCIYEPLQGGYSDVSGDVRSCGVLYEYGWENPNTAEGCLSILSVRFRQILLDGLDPD